MNEMEHKVLELYGPNESSAIYVIGTALSLPYLGGETTWTIEEMKSKILAAVKKRHTSILEHVNISLLLQTDIAIYKGLTRHRHCSFTIESTQFRDYRDKQQYLLPYYLMGDEQEEYDNDMGTIHSIMNKWYNKGKEYKDTAHLFIPQGWAAKVMCTTNIREWRYIIGLRDNPNDNKGMQALAQAIRMKLIESYPFFFQTIPLEKQYV